MEEDMGAPYDKTARVELCLASRDAMKKGIEEYLLSTEEAHGLEKHAAFVGWFNSGSYYKDLAGDLNDFDFLIEFKYPERICCKKREDGFFELLENNRNISSIALLNRVENAVERVKTRFGSEGGVVQNRPSISYEVPYLRLKYDFLPAIPWRVEGVLGHFIPSTGRGSSWIWSANEVDHDFVRKMSTKFKYFRNVVRFLKSIRDFCRIGNLSSYAIQVSTMISAWRNWKEGDDKKFTNFVRAVEDLGNFIWKGAILHPANKSNLLEGTKSELERTAHPFIMLGFGIPLIKDERYQSRAEFLSAAAEQGVKSVKATQTKEAASDTKRPKFA